MCVRLRGECLYDNYARELSISVRDMVETAKEEREDTAEEKRVELHMHTNMSTMDARSVRNELSKIRDVANVISADMAKVLDKNRQPVERRDEAR